MKHKITEIVVRSFHLDLYRHVNNARYLEFLEEARWNYYHKVYTDEWIARENIAFIIHNINITYRSPAVVGDTIVIHTSLKELGNVKLTVYQKLVQKSNGKVIAEADVCFVAVDMNKNAPIRLKGKVRELLMLPELEE